MKAFICDKIVTVLIEEIFLLDDQNNKIRLRKSIRYHGYSQSDDRIV